MTKKVVHLLIITLICHVAYATENYCHDAETNEYWENLKIRAADNIDIINLANYRKDLCAQVERGELTVQEATDLFEFERSRVVDELRHQEELRMQPHENKA